MPHFEHSIKKLGRDHEGRSQCRADDVIISGIANLGCVRCGWEKTSEHKIIEEKAQRMKKQGIVMTKGITIDIYEKPVTSEALEGQAVVKSIEAGPYKRFVKGKKVLVYVLSVRFPADDFNVIRHVVLEA